MNEEPIQHAWSFENSAFSKLKKLLEDKIQGIKSTMTDAEFQALKETGIIWEVKSEPKENL